MTIKGALCLHHGGFVNVGLTSGIELRRLKVVGGPDADSVFYFDGPYDKEGFPKFRLEIAEARISRVVLV